MYVPAYPLPILELASHIKTINSEINLKIISIPMDYGLPLTPEGKNKLYQKIMEDISDIKPNGIGISCTAISQAEETIHLCELIKKKNPKIFTFIGGYFPTIYYKEIFNRTSAVDLIVAGEGEISSLRIMEKLQNNEDPRTESIPNLIWSEDGKLIYTKQNIRFDLREKPTLKLDLLKNPESYDVLPYSFSRGCPYKCNFCMEDYIRPIRKTVNSDVIEEDLKNLASVCEAKDIVVCDALFKSFEFAPLLRELKMKMHFETRCDVMDSSIIPSIADVCGTLVLGFESASYDTLCRMNKVRDKNHYNKYMINTKAIFKEAVRNEIPVMVFMIAGYPGDKEDDLKKTLDFAYELSSYQSSGGHIFKIGECHVYPNTKIHDLALSLPDVVYDNDGVFGNNIVRQSSRGMDFQTIRSYASKIYNLSNNTIKLQEAFLKMVPFFRLPAEALTNDMIPDICYKDKERNILEVDNKKLHTLKKLLPELKKQTIDSLSGDRSDRMLKI